MTYWNNKGTYQDDYDELFKLVPPSGEAKEPHIELLRCISKLYYRFYNDGDRPDCGEYDDYLDTLRDDGYLEHSFTSMDEEEIAKILENTCDEIILYAAQKEKDKKDKGPLKRK